MAAAKKATTDPRGLKRICAGCGTRFYDLNKRPIVCPSCDTEFTGEIKVKARRGRTAAAVEESKASEAKAAPAKANDDADDEADDVEVVSLEDAAAEENNDDDADDVADADLDLDNVEDDDDNEEDDLSDLKGDVDISSKPEKE